MLCFRIFDFSPYSVSLVIKWLSGAGKINLSAPEKQQNSDEETLLLLVFLLLSVSLLEREEVSQSVAVRQYRAQGRRPS